MPSRVLVVDPKNCTGCGLCRIVCSMVKVGIGNPAGSRIQISRLDRKGQYLPVFCQHCEDAPCMAVCPKEAIRRDAPLQSVKIDYDVCISCRMCMFACPFGAVGFDEDRQMVFKCDLCSGQPQCVKYCFYEALDFVEDYRQQYPNLRKAAKRLTGKAGPIRLG